MKQMIISPETIKTHNYIEIINHGDFSSYFSISYNYNNQNFNFKSKTLQKGMLEKILIPKTATSINVLIYLKLSTGQSTVLYSKFLSSSTMFKLLLEGTEQSPKYHNITANNSVVEANHLPQHHVSVSNKGLFIAMLQIDYILNNQKYYVSSAPLLQNHHGKILIPTTAQYINISVVIKDNNNPWKTIYNKILNVPEILNLSLSGTIDNPQCKDITSESSELKLPALVQESLYVVNNGDFTSKFTINYSLLETQQTITTSSFSKGNFKSLNIPENAIDIEFIIYILNSDDSWFIVYQDFFDTPTSFRLQLSGTLFAPIVTAIKNDTPEVGTPDPVTPPKILLTKSPNNPVCLLGSETTFILDITNKEGVEATNVVLKDTLPSEAAFVNNSLTLDGKVLNFDIFSQNGLSLGSIATGVSHKITYKLIFKSVPNPNPVKYDPTVTYSYVESDSTIKSDSLTGTTLPLLISQDHHCCCPCMNYCNNSNSTL